MVVALHYFVSMRLTSASSDFGHRPYSEKERPGVEVVYAILESLRKRDRDANGAVSNGIFTNCACATLWKPQSCSFHRWARLQNNTFHVF